MFKLLRYFSLTSAVAILSVTIVLVMLYRQTAVNELIELAEAQNVGLARSFANTIWPRFSGYVTSVSGLDGDALRARPETRQIHDALKALSAGLPVLKVKIYNLDGLTVFSSQASQIGDDKSNNPGFFAAAREGRAGSKLAHKERFSTFSGEALDRHLVETYLPIRRGDGPIEAVFELYSDVTPLIGKIERFTSRLAIGLLLVFGLLYAVLFLIVRRADRILKQQYIDLLRGEQALQEANERLEQRVEERTRTLTREIAERKRAEKKIRDLANFPEQNPEPVLRFAADGKLLYANPASGRVLKELACGIGEPAPEDWRRMFTQVLETGASKEFEYACADRTLSFLISTVPETGYVIVRGRDITKRKQAEVALRESEERFRILIDGSSQGILVHRNLRTLYVNQSLVEMFGYDSADEILALESREAMTAPEERARLLGYHEARLRGEPAPVDYEYRGLRKDGSKIWLENRSFHIDWEGGPAICTTLFDITERKQAAVALRESKEQFRAVVDNSPTKIHIKDLDGRYTLINRQSEILFGVTDEEARGKTSRDIFPKEVADSFAGHDQAVIDSGQTIENEEEWVQDDGVHTFLTVKFPIRGATGEIVAVGAIGTDITERKQAEEEIRRLNTSLEGRVVQRTAELEAANKELEAFSYSVSHDLRAPLRTIDGFSRILLEEHAESLDDEGKNYLQRVRAGSQKMGQLIDAVLQLSRLARGNLKRKELDLSKIVDSIVGELKESQPDRDMTFKVARGVTAAGDEQLIKVALQNLLGNAVKYTGKKDQARIEFGVTNGDGRNVYFVRDNGAGFDMSYADKLFAPFQRAHGAAEFEGTGIGLATVQRIINRHRGTVWAEAEVDNGATFFFTLSQEG
ncbi:MAG: PAS domain S-box protein [Proteobacteria bacterium]|nr:PAS domain S-box protein [Pseudomonadota bacterium]